MTNKNLDDWKTDFRDRDIYRIEYESLGDVRGYWNEVGRYGITAIKAVLVAGNGAYNTWFDIYENDELVATVPPHQVTLIVYKNYLVGSVD